MRTAKKLRLASKRRSGGRKKADSVHLHIENAGYLGPIFQVTKERLQAALKRHPAVAAKIKVTLGTDGENYDKEIASADALFGWSFDRKGLAERAPQLKWVHAHGAGVNHLFPLDWLPNGAVLTNSRGVHGDRASEYAMMAILALNNRLPEMVTNQFKARWQQLYNTAISGKTLLVIGVGSVGGSTAILAKKFRMRTVGVRRSGKPHPGIDEMHRPRALNRLIPKADFILVTAPHTNETHHLMGSPQIALMRKGAGLLNYSRANLVDYGALRKRLQRNEISAVLDVFDPEPLPSSSPLWKTPNLIITPHSSSDDSERYTPDTLDLVFRNLARFMKGKPLMNRVDPDLGY
jgi:phosphoglycerate dehydrogenase-like enzyme